MAVQRIEDLQRGLDRELAWRKKEISGLRLSAMKSDSERHYLFRAGLVLLCAHWEGFLKRGASLYLDHVFSQGLRIADLTPLMVAVAFFDDVKNASGASFPNSERHHISLARRILQGLDEVCVRPGWNISTGGNPGSELLEKILESIGVDPRLGMDGAAWGATVVFIDEQILRDRHHVAHGMSFRLSRNEFLDRAERLSSLLDALHSTIMSSAVSRSYRKAA